MKTLITLSALFAATFALTADTVGGSPSPFTQNPGSMTHGFKLVWTKDVNELKLTARLFQHERSGAPLLYISNDDDNKVFCISFRTPPTDSTGIAHIMEHSALCGSDKYPVKEPFVDLLKSSLQTFLNAFTADDRTMYPVASTNDKDFYNLMNVYLDAVFFPNVRKIPEILMQEGWHYEVDEKTGNLTYNGIVYNEMKGVYSSPQSVLYRTIQKSLYPDATYANDSGGNPDDIPNLTQETFVKFHEKFYHPSNSLLYLYGNGDIEKHLEFLDKEYLNKFNKIEVNAAVKPQSVFAAPKDITAEYSVDEGESTKEKTFLSMNYLLPADLDDAERAYGMDFLTYILIDSEAGPLKRALLDAGIGLDVDASFDSSILQPCFSIVVQNSEPEKKQQFLDVLNKTLTDLVKNGIDRRIIEGAINRNEFSLREFQVGGFPKGLALDMWITESWIYGGDPLRNLRFEGILENIRKEVPNNYFEKLIRKYLLDNTSRGFVMLVPKPGLEKEHAAELAEKLAAIKKSLSPEQLENIKKEQQALLKRQSEPDKPEDIAKIPTLDISDVDKEAEEIPFQKDESTKIKIVNTDVDTNGIVYFGVQFQLEPWKHQPEILSFLSDVLGRLDTEHYSYSDLNTEIDLHTGGIGTGLSVTPLAKKPEMFTLRIGGSVKTTLPKLEKGLELLYEVLTQTKFDDKDRLKEILQEHRVGMQQSMMAAGHNFAQRRAKSYFSGVSRYSEQTDGIEYYCFLTDLEKNWDNKKDEFAAALKKYAAELFTQKNGEIYITLPKDDFAKVKPVIEKFEAKFKQEPAMSTAGNGTSPALARLNEAVVIPSKVQYVVKAGDFRQAGFEYSGKMLVLTNILRTGYLWNNIRVQGGAYGGGVSMSRNGSFTLWSYRDPHLKRTVDLFDGVADYLENLQMSEDDLEKAVISTIGSLDKPQTPAGKGGQTAAMQMSGLTQEDIQRERNEVLSTTVEDLRKFAPLFREGLKQGNICVFGNEQKIEADKALFKTTIRPIE
ncbi:MAG: insulinase family protein [Planctomycetaceae bacterium]|jgi:Zn-dependent M16 (insulinase) family peptidase|nr:insulinase family protein [Planctomycetaceae bacterium]